MRMRIRAWFMRQFVAIFVAEKFERIVGTVPCRGVIYIVTDCRIFRYDPERDEVSAEGYTR